MLAKVVLRRHHDGDGRQDTAQRAARSVFGQILVRLCFLLCVFFFLLTRFKSNHPNLLGYFVISKVTRAGKVIHIRIKHFPGGTFCVEGTDQEFATLQQLVQTSQYLHLEMDKVSFLIIFLLLLVLICFFSQGRQQLEVLVDFHANSPEPASCGLREPGRTVHDGARPR